MEIAMDAEEKSRLASKRLYKVTIEALKIIPMLLSLCALLNTIFSFYGIDTDILSHIGGISLLPLGFLYLVSYVFRFCVYHRLFLDYLLVTDILNLVDFYIGIPISDRGAFGLYLLISGVFLFAILYYHQKEKCCK